MNTRAYSDPITGLEFHAVTDKHGCISFQTAFCGVVTAEYNEIDGTYTIPAWILQHRPIMTLNECAEFLDVSKVRASRMCATGTIKSIKVGDRLVIDRKSAEQARKERER